VAKDKNNPYPYNNITRGGNSDYWIEINTIGFPSAADFLDQSDFADENGRRVLHIINRILRG